MLVSSSSAVIIGQTRTTAGSGDWESRPQARSGSYWGQGLCWQPPTFEACLPPSALVMSGLAFSQPLRVCLLLMALVAPAGCTFGLPSACFAAAECGWVSTGSLARRRAALSDGLCSRDPQWGGQHAFGGARLLQPLRQAVAVRAGTGNDGPSRQVYRLPLLRDVRKLDELVEILTPILEAGTLSPREACVASNHLSRLLCSDGSRRGSKAAQQLLMRLADIAAAGMHELGSKHMALSLNAARQLERVDGLFEAALARLHALPDDGFGAQNSALVLNAFATYATASHSFRRVLQGDERAEPRMLALALAHTADDAATWQGVSSCANAAASLGWSREHMHALLSHVRGAVAALPAEAASAQACALIANACAGVSFQDEELLGKLSAGVRACEGRALSAQAVAMLLNACSRLEYRDQALVRALCASARGMPLSAFTPHALALVLNGMSGLSVRDAELLERLAEATTLLTPKSAGLHSQDLANIANAFVRLRHRNPRVLSHVANLLESAVVQGLIFKDVEIAAVCHAYSKTLMEAPRSDAWQARDMAQRVLLSMGRAACTVEALGMPAAASILNSYTKLGLWDGVLLDKVSSAVLSSSDVALGDAVQCYHALASLYFRGEAIQQKLASVVAKARPQDFTVQSLGNCAWAAAVLDEQHEGMHAALEGALNSRFEEFLSGKEVYLGDVEEGDATVYHELQELRQVHQYLLSRRLSGSERSSSGGRGEVCRSVFEARSRNRAASSALQDRVQAVLREMGFRVRAEHVDAATGYSIDLKCTVSPEWLRKEGARARGQAGGDTFAVEVDGPAHFARPGCRRPLGKTMLKRAHLTRTGWQVVSIPFFEWNELEGREEKERYLSNLFLQAREQPSSAPPASRGWR